MTLRNAYFVALAAFLLSVPIALNMDTIVLRARGYDEDLVAMRETETRRDVLDRIDDALRQETPRIAFWIRLMVFVWAATFVFSVVVIRQRVAIPFWLHYAGAIASGLLLVVILVPILLFGRGWPPRPF